MSCMAPTTTNQTMFLNTVNVFAGPETEMWVLLITSIKSRKDFCSLNVFSHSQIIFSQEKIKPEAVLHEAIYFWFVSFPATPKITLTEAICVGCFHPISSDSSKVSEILKQAIQKFNKHSAEPALFKLMEIKEAKVQVCV